MLLLKRLYVRQQSLSKTISYASSLGKKNAFCTTTRSIKTNKKDIGLIPDDITKHYASFQLICLLRECQRCNILDAIPLTANTDNLLSIQDIAKKCNVKNPDNLSRTLRFLSSYGYTKKIKNDEDNEYYYIHTDESKQYAKNPDTEKPFSPWQYNGLATMASPVFMQPYKYLNEWMVNDQVPFEHYHKIPLYGEHSFVEQTDKAINQQFVSTMYPWFRAHGFRTMDDIADNYDFSDLNVIADVGGGTGSMCAPILRKYKNMKKAIIYDTQNIIDQGKQQNVSIFGNNASKVEYVVGDFLKEINVTNADVFLLRWILHDWPDKDCYKIISNVRKSMDNNNNTKQDGKRLLIAEFLINDDETMDINNPIDVNAHSYDISMAVFFNAKERTVSQYDEIMKNAGNFQRVSVTPMSAVNLIEYKPV